MTKKYTEEELRNIQDEDIKDPRYRILYRKIDTLIEVVTYLLEERSEST